MRSAVYCILGERLYAYMKAKNAASATPSISHHHPTNMSDMPNTSAVKAGRSAPKLANCSLKIGTTYTIRMPQTRIAKPKNTSDGRRGGKDRVSQCRSGWGGDDN